MRPGKLISSVFGILAVCFLLLPLVVILPLAFTSSLFLIYPIPSFSLRWFDVLVTNPVWRAAIVNSLIIGIGTTLLSTVLGGLASLGLREKLRFVTTPLSTLFLLPMVVPAVVLGVGLQILYARFGLSSSYLGMIIAHTVIAIPLVMVSVTNSLQGMDTRLELASASLGAGPAATLWHVTLPLAVPGILTGAVLAFAVSLDEVVLNIFLAGPGQRTIARQMFAELRDNISPAIAAAAFLFIAGTIVLMALVLIMRRRAGGTAS
ncbi:ABC transporter permease [Ancylobacter sp. G4_0304]|uniref:ABC transporter permease n=1 Tax=Ancylobacter sp. G4_0304 TaxID=3114289 RepID=UPI0039C7022F